MEIHMPDLAPSRHKASPLHRDVLTRIDNVECAIFEITHGAS
jgi:hypothetical protein